MNGRALYNENDDFMADWLERLIEARVIAPGVVDRRSVVDLVPAELAEYTQVHLFAGLGGWSAALRAAGWPDDRQVWTWSEPCQPFSAAGKGLGFADERYLRPFVHHLVSQCRPATAFGEQVASKDGLAWRDVIQSDMEGEDYAFWCPDICSAGFGAPHIRQRLYWVAEPNDTERRTDSAGRHDRNGTDAGWPQGAGDAEGRIGARLLADANDAGSQGRVIEPGGRTTECVAGPSGVAGGVGKPHSDGQQARRFAAAAARHGRSADAAGAVGGLADSKSDGRGEEREDARRFVAGDRQEGVTAGLMPSCGSNRPHPTNGFWSNPDWLYCRDGKWRPVEPGTFPLAHGLPRGLGTSSAELRRLAEMAGLDGKSLARAKAYRVGTLGGYGNAINIEQTTEFVRAYLDGSPVQRGGTVR